MVAHESNVVALRAENLPTIGSMISIPRYDRTSLKAKVYHIGVGGFHRAHMARYTDQLLESGESDWAICGVGLMERDRRMAEVMQLQGGLYTLLERSPDTDVGRVVGSIVDFRFVPDGAGDLCREIVNSGAAIVSLTVTESGYHYIGEERMLDDSHEAIVHDLKNPENPVSPVGVIFRIAQLCVEHNVPFPTFLSCDNIPKNGDVLRALVTQFATRVDPDTEHALADRGCFPNSMVDRITPATSEIHRQHMIDAYGIIDEWPVICESFRQWFIEDTFTQGRPEWERVGAVFVSDVIPFERMKIRLLNGTHSALSYLSYLAGYTEVDRVMDDRLIRRFVGRYMAEIVPTVGSIPNVDLEDYCNTLVARFSNPAVPDQVLRLAQDGSRKIPNAILEPLEELIRSDASSKTIAFAIASWIRFLQGSDELGNEIRIEDPAADFLKTKASKCKRDAMPFLRETGLFSDTLIRSVPFTNDVSRWLNSITTRGILSAIEQLLDRY